MPVDADAFAPRGGEHHLVAVLLRKQFGEFPFLHPRRRSGEEKRTGQSESDDDAGCHHRPPQPLLPFELSPPFDLLPGGLSIGVVQGVPPQLGFVQTHPLLEEGAVFFVGFEPSVQDALFVVGQSSVQLLFKEGENVLFHFK